jgi:hypothetical protein
MRQSPRTLGRAATRCPLDASRFSLRLRDSLSIGSSEERVANSGKRAAVQLSVELHDTNLVDKTIDHAVRFAPTGTDTVVPSFPGWVSCLERTSL